MITITQSLDKPLLAINFEQLSPMSQHRQWINWNSVLDKDGKTLKMPSALDGATGKAHSISAHEGKNWQTLDTVVSLYERGYFTGIGYVTTKDNNIVGGDVDGCVHNGLIDPQVMELLRRFNTRTEFSPSGNGVRFWFSVQDKTALLPYLQYKRIKVSGSREIEMYGYAQFLTVTNRLVPGFPVTVNDATDALLDLYANQQNSRTHGIVQQVDWDDVPHTLRSEREVLELACRSTKFKILHETGRPELAGVGVNESGEADMSSAEYFYFNALLEHAENDPRMTLDIYRSSALYRDKAAEWRNGIPYDQYSVSRTLARRLAKNDGVPAVAVTTVTHDVPEWLDAPTRIGHRKPEVPHLTDDMLPPALSAYVMDEAERMNVYPENVAVALLSSLGILIGSGLSIKGKMYDDWRVYPNLWGFVVGPPGSRKTDAIQAGLYPLKTLNRIAKQQYQEAISEFAPKATAFKTLLDAYKSGLKSAAQKGESDRITDFTDKITDIEAKLQGPTRRRFMTNDATPEALLTLAIQNPRGILSFNDELEGLFARFSKVGRESERTLFLSGWSRADDLDVDRKGDGNTSVDKLTLSMFGGTQPSVLAHHMRNAYGNGKSADGLFQRFQLAVINEDYPPYRNVDRQPNYQAREAVVRVFQSLESCDFMQFGAALDPSTAQPFVRYTPEAYAVFAEWLERNDQFYKALKDEDDQLSSHFAKYNTLVPALSLLFYLVDCVEHPRADSISEHVVDLTSLRRALQWCEFLKAHAQEIYRLGKSQAVNDTSMAIRVLKKLRERKKKSDTANIREDIYRRLSGKKMEIDEALKELAEHGWLKISQTRQHVGASMKVVILYPNFDEYVDKYYEDTKKQGGRA